MGREGEGQQLDAAVSAWQHALASAQGKDARADDLERTMRFTLICESSDDGRIVALRGSALTHGGGACAAAD